MFFDRKTINFYSLGPSHSGKYWFITSVELNKLKGKSTTRRENNGITLSLFGRLQESEPSRIVNLTTNTEFQDHIDFDTNSTYVKSMLSLNRFTLDPAQRLEGTGVTVNYLCPGYIKSNLLRNLEGAPGIMRFFMRVMACPPEVGADRIVRLAVSSEFQGVNGTYVCEDNI